MITTIDEAIRHCDEVANVDCSECGLEHKQLACWLRELKLWRELYDIVQKLLKEESPTHQDTWGDMPDVKYTLLNLKNEMIGETIEI